MKKITVGLIRGYQIIISPTIQLILLSIFGSSMKCKYSPTCSEYTIHQVKKHGTIIGLKKGVVRILSCH